MMMSDVPSLRVVWADDERSARDRVPSGLSPELTLGEFYARFVLPVCHESRSRRERTVEAYRESLALWAMLTGDPPIGRIDDACCAEFTKRLSQRPGLQAERLSPSTVRKHCAQLQFVLDRAGPRSRGNRVGQGLVSEVAWFERPRIRRKLVRDRFELDEIERWLEVLPQAARLPRLLDAVPEVWWRALVVLIYNTALRIGSVMEARWDWIGGKEREWLTVPGDEYKTGDELVFYLNTSARAALDSLRGLTSGDDGRIFRWPRWPESKGWLQTMRRRQLEATRLPPPRRFGFRGLRKASLHWLAERNPLVARKVAGHRDLDVLSDHYVGPEVVVDLLERLPQPGAVRQKRLF